MTDRVIIHVDMDAFFAAVEVRDNPELAGKPLIIGALPHERGVVSTCSYEARKYGVRSAMSIKDAYRRCPHGIYMHPNGHKYYLASQQVHAIWKRYTDLIECVSLDEGYLDVTGSAHLYGGFRSIGHEIKRRVRDEVGLSCSVGIGYSLMSAKLASEEKKPDGYFEILSPQALRELIAQRSVRIIFGVGQKTAEILQNAGLYTVSDLYEHREKVVQVLGNQGINILELADGRDERKVTPYSEPKSIGREHTFQQDITDFEHLKAALLLIARELSFDIHRQGLYCGTITLKVTYHNMQSITRSQTGEPTNRSDVIYKVAAMLLERIERRPIRLVGISLGHLSKTNARQLSLMEHARDERKEKLDAVAFALQQRFGMDAIKTGNELIAQRRLNADEVHELD